MKTLRAKRFVPLAVHTDGWTIPVEVVSESNRREHWAVRNKRKNEQQLAVCLALVDNSLKWLKYLTQQFKTRPMRVVFTRLGGRRMDQSNLAVSFKGIEDQLAHMLGIDDGHPHWLPVFEQEPGGLTGVRIKIEAV